MVLNFAVFLNHKSCQKIDSEFERPYGPLFILKCFSQIGIIKTI